MIDCNPKKTCVGDHTVCTIKTSSELTTAEFLIIYSFNVYTSLHRYSENSELFMV